MLVQNVMLAAAGRGVQTCPQDVVPRADIDEFATFQGFELQDLVEKETTMGSREELLERSIPFLREIKDMTPGAEMEESGTYVLFDASTRL